MSDSGCYLLDEGKPCGYPDKRARSACSGLVYSKERGFVEDQDGPCPYWWFWENLDDEEDDGAGNLV
jgi:hypothetical protein